MVEPLNLVISNQSAIPIELVAKTVSSQFWISIGISLLGLAFILFFFGKPILTGVYVAFFKVFVLRLFKRHTKRHLLIINHKGGGDGIFSTPSMITTSDVFKIEKALRHFKGKPFDLLLHTPGGEIFATQIISRLFKEYKGNIRSIIPFYAMSGGTILALSTDSLVMGNVSSLGPVDPQIGLLAPGSAAGWQDVVRSRGNKANDTSFLFSMMGKQYTSSIKGLLRPLLACHLKPNRVSRSLGLMTGGGIEHGFRFTPDFLVVLGFDVYKPSLYLDRMGVRIVRNMPSGVYYL